MRRNDSPAPRTDDGRGIRYRLDDQFEGLVVTVVGLSQALLSLTFFPARPGVGFVVGSGGWLLIGVGANLLRNRKPVTLRWFESGALQWVDTIIFLVLTAGVLLTAVTIAVTGLG